ncbi:MAG: flagellar export protein FliJ [Ignavibacteriaceae bacterium]
MKFVYKFDAIKKIKEIFEKRVQKEVAAIQLEIEKKEEEYNAILLQRVLESKRDMKHISSSELKFHKNYLGVLSSELGKIRKEIDLLGKKKDEKLLELIQKSKEHKIFNTLEEIHFENFTQEQNKLEMISIDEIATQKFARNKN